MLKSLSLYQLSVVYVKFIKVKDLRIMKKEDQIIKLLEVRLDFIP